MAANAWARSVPHSQYWPACSGVWHCASQYGIAVTSASTRRWNRAASDMYWSTVE